MSIFTSPERQRHDQQQAFVAERRRVSAEIQAARQDLQRAEERCTVLLASWREADVERGRIAGRIADISHRFDRVRSEYERAMRESAPAAIGAFVDRCEARKKALRHEVVEREGLGPIDIKTGRRPTTHSSNLDAIQLVAVKLIDAARRAEELVYEPVDDLAAALEALWTSIPSVSEAEAQLRGAPAPG